MTLTAASQFTFENTYADELEGLYVPWQATQAPNPQLLAINEPLAAELGLDPHALRTPEGTSVLVGNAVVGGSRPLAQAYAGHQFGGYSPRLGDGRALLLGELIDVHGRRRDLHLKGSGRTPFARGGDGKAAVGPMLREYLIGEAMHALGIPTTRALAVIATGEEVARETMLPGAVLARVAASHLRVGTFQYVAAAGDHDLLRRLADHAIARHHPEAAASPNPYLALLQAVAEAQAALIARWMHVGFIHGVMNTDNMTISGETIDYGPCAFMDAFDPATVFSSIDHGGRYAYGNQPAIGQWNLARLAEALLPLIDAQAEAAIEAATEVLQDYAHRYHAHWLAGMRVKLGLRDEQPEDEELVKDLLSLLQAERLDWTGFFRSLPRGEVPESLQGWAARWRARQPDPTAMDRVNPVYIPRNHLVEEALAAATEGDLGPFGRLLDALGRPFDPRPGLERFAEPAPEQFCGSFRTFCGT